MSFRGPERPLDGDYVAVLGGSETFGKFVQVPFCDRLEGMTGCPVVNLGIMQAGPQVYIDDKALIDIASGAVVTVVQVMGAQNMSNRFYSVHPRRNDRFVGASHRLQALYPDLDFTDVNFTGHLLAMLEDRDEAAFQVVVAELKTAWVERMRRLLSLITGPCHLLWMPALGLNRDCVTAVAEDPPFVDIEMVEALQPEISGLVAVSASEPARAEGLKSRVYLPGEEAAAAALPGPLFHSEVAEALRKTLGPSVARDP